MKNGENKMKQRFLSASALGAAFFVIAGTSLAQDQASYLDEIVVTAEKKSQNIQETTVAITAIPGETLVAKGITDIRAAQQFVPSVRFQQQNAATEIYIRGVGSTLDFPNIDPPTAFNLNGIYIPREGTSVPLFDVEQLEALPGPQGTLYGRGVLGGVVNVNFNRPSDKLETKFVLEAGNFDSAHITAVQNIPVGENFAVRGGVDYYRRDGYLESGADSAEDYAVQLAALYEPTDKFSAYVWARVVEKDGNSPNLVALGVNEDGSSNQGNFIQDDPYNDLLPDSLLAVSPFGQVDARDQDYENFMISGELSYDITDSISLTYIPSYLDFSVDVEYWLSGLPSNKFDSVSQQTHELRGSGSHSWGEWLAGAYYYKLENEGEFFVASFDSSGFPVSLIDDNEIEGIALFGEATYDVSDRLSITGGLRYSSDERTGEGRFFNGAGLSPFESDEDYDNIDYKIAVSYELADDIRLYAKHETGYQPGTYNTFASTDTISNQVEAADLKAYTAGFKSRWFNGHLQVNNEVFYYDYQDLFASAFDTVLGTTRAFNAQEVEIYGNQLDILWRPTENDQFNFNLGYLHARNEDFTLPENVVNPTGLSNFDGFQLQYAPDWTVSAGYHHDFDIKSGYIRGAVNTRYESSFFADFANAPGGRQDDYTKTDASITYFDEDGKWSFGVWAKNLEDEAVIAATAVGSNFPANSLGATAYLEAPRTYGVRLTLDFGE